jgi:hypothetical protein
MLDCNGLLLQNSPRSPHRWESRIRGVFASVPLEALRDLHQLEAAASVSGHPAH